MFRFKNYVKVQELKEAYELNQKKSNVVLGGTLWLKMEDINKQTAIDLSGLGLDKITETSEEFIIGCMVSLRDLELHPSLNESFQNGFKEAVRHIVGVQFRNCATVGGSIFARFGFSDVLTLFLALDSYVELYKGGRVSMKEFVKMPRNNDILVSVIVKKDNRKVCYLSERRSSTDFPLISCAAACHNGEWTVSVGARPARAMLFSDDQKRLSEIPGNEEIDLFIQDMKESVTFGTNMRGSEEYRRHLAGVLIRRGIQTILKDRTGGVLG